MNKPVNKYGDYKKNRHVIDIDTKQVYIIIDRNHQQRTVFLRPIETEAELQNPQRKIYAGGRRYGRYMEMGNWRTLKELRKFYRLLDPKVMSVLYGSKV